MPKTYTISEADVGIIEELRKQTSDKQVDKRLHAVKLRGEGRKNTEIAEQLETSTDMVSRWISTYVKHGGAALLPKPRPGRPTNMRIEEEAKMLAEFEAKAAGGQVVEVSDIKAAYEEKVGHKIGSSQIYYVLKRHKWRKIKPRSRHPKKASPEVIAATKKLTTGFKN